ncbi:hypothetical protein EDI_295110 [Entamoeba dispar SAW760]|uniref:TLDc domain-containing protein n=1 Tax=Entamoeba dispar (strain ATCC PRA-260 / SAW760) TaxID=370354 RepID=B0EI90_ENTDS|nr:uncharacterized protein EDI_295110 [Entamoeba dispar SAW760]EDR25738.1 hypothetical protein EDI_295110 [Entamoeba dispar SAW760]|eukprot:EDR25738.1 hypothetical protein EDI_295110 [Entamoeba dispar SAW760]
MSDIKRLINNLTSEYEVVKMRNILYGLLEKIENLTIKVDEKRTSKDMENIQIEEDIGLKEKIDNKPKNDEHFPKAGYKRKSIDSKTSCINEAKKDKKENSEFSKTTTQQSRDKLTQLNERKTVDPFANPVTPQIPVSPLKQRRLRNLTFASRDELSSGVPTRVTISSYTRNTNEFRQPTSFHLMDDIKLTYNDPFFTSLMTKHFQTLQYWTGFNHIQIIYDSNKNKFTRHSVQKRLYEKKNIMGVIITEDEAVFGSFHHSTFPKKPKKAFVTVKDPDMFVFSLENRNRLAGPTRWLIKQDSPGVDWSISFYSDKEKDPSFYNVYQCFTLRPPLNQHNSSLNSEFKFEYENAIDISAFTGNKENFAVKRLFFLQWYQ